MTRIAIPLFALALVAAACGGSDQVDPTDTTTSRLLPTPPEDAPGLRQAAEAAIGQVELGGLRKDLDFTVADSLFNASNSCAAVVFVVDTGQGEEIVSTAYMVRTAGRSAVDIFPRAEAMQPAFLERWDDVVGDNEWGLLALAPPETDVEDVSTVCSGPFLDEVLRRHFAVQIEPG